MPLLHAVDETAVQDVVREDPVVPVRFGVAVAQVLLEADAVTEVLLERVTDLLALLIVDDAIIPGRD